MVQSTHKARVYSKQAIKTIGALGAFSGVLVLPGSALLLDELMKHMDKNSAKRTISYLKYRKLVDVRDCEDGTVEYRLTNKARKTFVRQELAEIEINTPLVWDKKWRIIIFDLPTDKKLERQQLLDKLKELDFYMLQKSTWIHPFDSEIQIGALLSLLEIEQYASYLVAEYGNFQDHAERHFIKKGLLQ